MPLDPPPPAREDVLDGRAHRVRDEDEKAVAGLDDRAPARRDRVVAAHDHGDDRGSRQADLSNGRTCDRVIGRDDEVEEVQRARSRRPRSAARASVEPARRGRASGDPLEGRPLQDRRDDHDEEDGVEDRVRLVTCDDSTNVARTIGTAPLSPAQPSRSRSRAVKSLNAVDTQTATGRIRNTSSSANASPETATSVSWRGNTSRPSTMNSATWARNARPSWKPTSCRR